MEKCDTCQKAVVKGQVFKGHLQLQYQGERLSFMGEQVERPSFNIGLTLCDKCALLVMSKNKGILLNG